MRSFSSVKALKEDIEDALRDYGEIQKREIEKIKRLVKKEAIKGARIDVCKLNIIMELKGNILEFWRLVTPIMKNPDENFVRKIGKKESILKFLRFVTPLMKNPDESVIRKIEKLKKRLKKLCEGKTPDEAVRSQLNEKDVIRFDEIEKEFFEVQEEFVDGRNLSKIAELVQSISKGGSVTREVIVGMGGDIKHASKRTGLHGGAGELSGTELKKITKLRTENIGIKNKNVSEKVLGYVYGNLKGQVMTIGATYDKGLDESIKEIHQSIIEKEKSWPQEINSKIARLLDKVVEHDKYYEKVLEAFEKLTQNLFSMDEPTNNILSVNEIPDVPFREVVILELSRSPNEVVKSFYDDIIEIGVKSYKIKPVVESIYLSHRRKNFSSMTSEEIIRKMETVKGLDLKVYEMITDIAEMTKTAYVRNIIFEQMVRKMLAKLRYIQQKSRELILEKTKDKEMIEEAERIVRKEFKGVA